LLGETYELSNDSFDFFAEQISHHPPISAWICRGRKPEAAYKMWGNLQIKANITSTDIKMKQTTPIYIELPESEFGKKELFMV